MLVLNHANPGGGGQRQEGHRPWASVWDARGPVPGLAQEPVKGAGHGHAFHEAHHVGTGRFDRPSCLEHEHVEDWPREL
eukprot:9295038-Alexandrium_andersonii.AAC.1